MVEVESSTVDETTISKAMSMLPVPLHARHPDRACGGWLLMHRMKHYFQALGCNVGTSVSGKDVGSDIVRTLFLDSIPEDLVEIQSIRHVPNSRLFTRFLERISSEHCSIEATFHGTREEHLQSILLDGLCPDRCCTGAYGSGAYLATHSGTAHLYADPGTNVWRHMCVVLFATGKHMVKGRQGEQASVTAMDRLQNPTQYCVIDDSRMYVSHVITYRVTRQGVFPVGGGWMDPFQRELSLATSRAATRERKSNARAQDSPSVEAEHVNVKPNS